MTEQEEIDELTTMFSSPGSLARDSPITAAKYNRWLVGEQNREVGGAVRGEIESLRRDRQNAAGKHREYGKSLVSRERENHDKISYDQMQRDNLAKGLRVKAEVMAQKAQEAKQKQEWIAHGKNLAMKDQLQRQKIRQVVGENSKRVAEMTAIAKQEELDYERNLREVRDKLKNDNIAEVKKVRSETADEVIDAAKEFSFEQRKSLAFATKAAESAWKDERAAHTKAHLAKARANRAEAVASRQKAKELREEIITSRQVVANAARKQMLSNKEAKEKTITFAAGGVKDTHDTIYKKKFVPKAAAEALAKSKYAKDIA
jgi:hypothetical protein